jgi:hypothetical protein
MTRDYGVRSGARRLNSGQITVIGFCLIGPVIIALLWGVHKYTLIATAHAWLVAGPACPALTPAAAAQLGSPQLQVFNFQGARFGKGYGYVNCRMVADHGGWGGENIAVCQFNNPSILDVTTPRGHAAYLTGGRSATISIDQGHPSCVLAASAGVN